VGLGAFFWGLSPPKPPRGGWTADTNVLAMPFLGIHLWT